MNVDVATDIKAVTRVVEDRVYNGKPACVIVATRTFDTTREDLWDALTNPERLPLWFLSVSGELRLGGRYQLQGNAGGKITRCDPPERLEITWEFGGKVSWVNVGVSDAPGSHAVLQLEHIAYPDAHWKQYGPGAGGVGWDMSLRGLALHFDPDAADGEFDEAAWTESDEGKAFIRGSGEGWIDAEIANAGDTADATRRGRESIAFYLGEALPDTSSGG